MLSIAASLHDGGVAHVLRHTRSSASSLDSFHALLAPPLQKPQPFNVMAFIKTPYGIMISEFVGRVTGDVHRITRRAESLQRHPSDSRATLDCLPGHRSGCWGSVTPAPAHPLFPIADSQSLEYSAS